VLFAFEFGSARGLREKEDVMTRHTREQLDLLERFTRARLIAEAELSQAFGGGPVPFLVADAILPTLREWQELERSKPDGADLHAATVASIRQQAGLILTTSR
jgi:hypothetical protein